MLWWYVLQQWPGGINLASSGQASSPWTIQQKLETISHRDLDLRLITMTVYNEGSERRAKLSSDSRANGSDVSVWIVMKCSGIELKAFQTLVPADYNHKTSTSALMMAETICPAPAKNLCHGVLFPPFVSSMSSFPFLSFPIPSLFSPFPSQVYIRVWGALLASPTGENDIANCSCIYRAFPRL